MKGAFGHRAFTKKTGRHRAGAQPFVGHGNAHGQRQPAAHNGVAAVKTVLAAEQVHGATASAATAFHLAQHLGQERRHGHTARQRMAVFAVGGQHRVARLQRVHHADRDRLFAVVQVQEAAYLLRLVELDALGLKAADAQHRAQQVVQVRTVKVELVGHGVASVISGLAAGPPPGRTSPPGGQRPAERRSVGALIFRRSPA